MKTIQEELNDLFTGLAKNSNSQAALDAVPAVPATTEPAVTPPVTPTEPVVPTAVVAPVEPVAPVETTFIEDWDGVTVTTPPATQAQVDVPLVPQVPSFDFSEIAKVLGREDVKTKEDVIKAVNEVKAQAETLSQIPESLAKAIEIAKSNGNYLEYLDVSVVDWSKEDPIVLYENYIEDQFFDQKTGLVDYDKVDKILEKLDDEEKELRGRDLQRSYIAHQNQQKAFLEQDARNKKSAFESGIKEVVSSLNEINGYKLTPSHKAELLSFVLSGEDLKAKSLQERVKNAFISKYFDSLDAYNKTKIKNATKREILQEAQVVSVTPSTEPTESSTSTKAYTMNDWLEDLKKKK